MITTVRLFLSVPTGIKHWWLKIWGLQECFWFRACLLTQKISLIALNTEGFSVDIPVLRIKRPVADFILAKSENTVESS